MFFPALAARFSIRSEFPMLTKPAGLAIAFRASDLDDDGMDDLLVGAFFENPNSDFFGAGRAYVLDGATDHFSTSSPLRTRRMAAIWDPVAGLNDVDGDGRCVSPDWCRQ